MMPLQWPVDVIHDCMTDVALACPAAMFSALPKPL
jgi:hypothetical protein